jgi:hypothetical protein
MPPRYALRGGALEYEKFSANSNCNDLVPDNDIFEMFCENEKDAAHIK